MHTNTHILYVFPARKETNTVMQAKPNLWMIYELSKKNEYVFNNHKPYILYIHLYTKKLKSSDVKRSRINTSWLNYKKYICTYVSTVLNISKKIVSLPVLWQMSNRQTIFNCLTNY